MERNARLSVAALVLTLTLAEVLVAQSSGEMGPPMPAPTDSAVQTFEPSLSATGTSASENGRGVPSGSESLRDLMTVDNHGPNLPKPPRQVSGVGSTLLRIMAWTFAVLALGAGGLFLLRKYTPLARNLNAGGAVRILGRTALSPKHTVFLLRVSNQKILVVGVSGDRMVNLSELSDPTAILGVDREFNAALDSFDGKWPERDDSESAPEGLYPSRISSHVGSAQETNADRAALPYQREVQKVRNLIGSWRNKLNRADSSEGPVGREHRDTATRVTGSTSGDGEL